MDQGVCGFDGDEEDAAKVLVGFAAEVAGEQVGEGVGDAVVGFAAGSDGDLVAEVDEEKPGAVRFMAMYSSSTASIAARQPPSPASLRRSVTRAAYRSRLRCARASAIWRLLPKNR